MTVWQAALLGLIQGLAEFLPVSSSGHLVLGEYVLGIEATDDIAFEVFVHFGTVLSICVVYARRIGSILGTGVPALLRPSLWKAALRPGPIEKRDGDEPDYAPHEAPTDVAALRLVLFVLLSMIPTGIVYVVFKDALEALFGDPRAVLGMLVVTGILLLLIRFRPNPDGHYSAGKALLAGLAQGAAMIPGISRSGSTIATSIYLNVNRKDAADFSFLMSLPVIVGATLIKTLELIEQGGGVDWLPILVGTVVAFGTGIVAIKIVLSFVQQGRLQYFAYYCFAVAALGFVLI
jgi:undecaprenyl-diphosphatase